MWFNKKDLTIKPIININNLYGYVLPHAGTSYTGQIISHTLRFRPTKTINKIIILYYPASDTPDINIYTRDGTTLSYYHEYYVPWKSLDYIFSNNKYNTPNTNNIIYEGYNIKDIYTTELKIDTIIKYYSFIIINNTKWNQHQNGHCLLNTKKLVIFQMDLIILHKKKPQNYWNVLEITILLNKLHKIGTLIKCGFNKNIQVK